MIEISIPVFILCLFSAFLTGSATVLAIGSLIKIKRLNKEIKDIEDRIDKLMNS